jgi:hypothetical protein
MMLVAAIARDLGPNLSAQPVSGYGKVPLADPINCVLVGEAIRHERNKIRFADIDASEINAPSSP